MGEPPATPVRVRDTATRPTLPVFHKIEEAIDNVVPMKRRDTGPVEIVTDEHNSEREDSSALRPLAPLDAAKPVKPTKGKRPIPSWDEILFGAPTDED